MVLKALDVAKAGNEIGKISVIISYQIIDLFSGHLYSSPAKAIEELVVNSYDAFANTCYVRIPEDWDSPDARILVFDDGDSMNEDGLRELWLIAECRKRQKDREEEAIKRGRPPIGKFGIGKLASYVVGQRISHVCRKDGRYLVVTMDYSGLGGRNSGQALDLPIRELSRKELESILNNMIPAGVDLPLLRSEEGPNWTLVVIDRLKEDARQIKEGRLGWILSTALPLDPTFKVLLNGREITASKLDEPKHKEWTIGADDKVAEDLKFEPFEETRAEPPFNEGIVVPGIGRVSGKFELYKPTITGGKAAEHGRSNGFFVVVRKRLLNLDDALFGSHALSHSTFNRFRAVIYADGLDDFLVSSREGVTQQGRELLNTYLRQKFYEVRNYYEKIQQIEEKQWPETLENLPDDLVRYPLNHALERSDQEEFKPWLIRRPVLKTEEHTTIKEIELKDLEPTDPVGIYDTETGVVKANTLHPFASNFPGDKSFKNWATVETMTEAYLLDAGLDAENVGAIMEKRDRLMRILVRYVPAAASVVGANILETASTDDRAFEVACERGFRALGMDVTRLGGSGKPDGIAAAHLGLGADREQRKYSLVYDAKTTMHEKVKAGNLKISSLKRHKELYRSDFAVIIAPDYEGEGENSAAVIEARQNEVTLLRAKDFADLIEASAVKPLSLARLRELFENCRSPDESCKWIQKFKTEPQRKLPIHSILQTIWELQTEKPKDPASFGAIKWKHPDRFNEFSELDIEIWLKSLQKLVPEMINVSSKSVALNQSPEITCSQIRHALEEMRDKELGKALEEQLDTQ
jgi:hypothetical protein